MAAIESEGNGRPTIKTNRLAISAVSLQNSDEVNKVSRKPPRSLVQLTLGIEKLVFFPENDK